MRRRLPLALAVSMAAGTFVACAGPSPERADCSGALTRTVDDLQGGLTVAGELRHGRMIEIGSPPTYFVSAELLPAGEDEDFPGDILTWATSSLDSGQYESVDVKAREKSGWPEATFDVRAKGAIESRGCVLPVRGTPVESECQPGLEAFC